jgi:hypothetical protein
MTGDPPVLVGTNREVSRYVSRRETRGAGIGPRASTGRQSNGGGRPRQSTEGRSLRCRISLIWINGSSARDRSTYQAMAVAEYVTRRGNRRGSDRGGGAEGSWGNFPNCTGKDGKARGCLRPCFGVGAGENCVDG